MRKVIYIDAEKRKFSLIEIDTILDIHKILNVKHHYDFVNLVSVDLYIVYHFISSDSKYGFHFDGYDKTKIKGNGIVTDYDEINMNETDIEKLRDKIIWTIN